MLVAEGFGQHVSKGSTYFAMGFALAVEVVNYRANRYAKIAAERSRAQHPTS
jgi:predicted tellurium resistance membrane protein TerC